MMVWKIGEGSAFQFDFRVTELGPYDMDDGRLDEK
jgi:hypothetical protein